jgi:hypothetical protein
MKRRLVLLMISMLVFCGCVTHYYRKNNDTLSIFLKKPGAKQVYFLSSLDGYKPRKATRIDNRTWRINTPAKTEYK